MPIIGMFLLLLALAGLPDLRRTIGTRIMKRAVIYVITVRALSLCFLIGFGIDIMLGAISLNLTERFYGPNSLSLLPADDFVAFTQALSDPPFLPTFIATCFQGAFLFVEFLFILLLAYPIAKHQIRKNADITSDCRNCGYDLRMTPTRCPECGTESTEVQRQIISDSRNEATLKQNQDLKTED